MNYKLLAVIFSLLIAIQGTAQVKKDAKKKESKKSEKKMKMRDKSNVYYEKILEDFEKTEFSDKNLKFRKYKDNQKAHLKIRDVDPAPYNKSKKYLGVKIFGRKRDAFTIIPAKELIIKKYCSSINIWVYGRGFTGKLFIIVEDANKDYNKLLMGQLNFLGWRKLTVKLTKKIAQEDKYLNQKKSIKITKILYEPGNSQKRQPIWQIFYIDDITARIREKYLDKQSDDW